ncbi:hypothetical protein QVD17_01901 [Tagetes erecta]|uniref:Uncharacterized protein n=1 Tax=Tagetes erecta TaxID=13708 RepID=A0AAD8P1X1_TARER|nr:hypothetical protein QVD17_01901 [Tagetes erecta]
MAKVRITVASSHSLENTPNNCEYGTESSTCLGYIPIELLLMAVSLLRTFTRAGERKAIKEAAVEEAAAATATTTTHDVVEIFLKSSPSFGFCRFEGITTRHLN